jgi:hypothetical protein
VIVCLTVLVTSCSAVAEYNSGGIREGYVIPTSDIFAVVDIARKWQTEGVIASTHFNLNGVRVMSLKVNEGYRLRLDAGVHDFCYSPSKAMTVRCFQDLPPTKIPIPQGNGSVVSWVRYQGGVLNVTPKRYCYEVNLRDFYEINCRDWDRQYTDIILVN